jgi:hypothetical protein
MFICVQAQSAASGARRVEFRQPSQSSHAKRLNFAAPALGLRWSTRARAKAQMRMICFLTHCQQLGYIRQFKLRRMHADRRCLSFSEVLIPLHSKGH